MSIVRRGYQGILQEAGRRNRIHRDGSKDTEREAVEESLARSGQGDPCTQAR